MKHQPWRDVVGCGFGAARARVWAGANCLEFKDRGLLAQNMIQDTADVQAAVKCAKAANVAVAPRSGGHSYEGYSIGGQDGSMVIDLAGLSSIVVTGDRAKVGSGVLLGPLYLELFKQGNWTINAGTCPSVGIGGHALGGGFGLLSRKYGLLSDRIDEMEVVNADGQVLTVSATQNPDLFFALRGAGGGSFGVVTSFTILPVMPAPVVTSLSYSWNHTAITQVLRAYVDVLPSASRDLGVELTVASDGLELYGLFQGTQIQLTAALDSFLKAAPKPTNVELHEGRYIDGVLRFAWMTGNPTDVEALSLKTASKVGDSRYTKNKSLVYSKPLLNSTIALLDKWTKSPPVKGSTGYIIVDLWGAAISEIPANATSFTHRDSHSVFQFVSEWGGANGQTPHLGDCADCLKQMDAMYKAFLDDYTTNYGPVAQGYPNYIDKSIPNWQQAYYGTNLDRLIQIKTSTDPSNVFRFPQSIPLLPSHTVASGSHRASLFNRLALSFSFSSLSLLLLSYM
ncbi:hypothetical protein BGX31_004557 [Mortierella sp. GBA43]|nr:hypothetical protein BGX31_004557 [Mortierella sp. GBA43]